MKVQTSNFTQMYRYQAILHQALRLRTSLGFPRPARILSYGCSTGEELISLRALFPTARIVGCDIDAAALARARSSTEGLDIQIFRSSWRRIRQFGPFDLIVANAVFCRHPESAGVDDLSTLYEFEDFDDSISEMGDVLRPGGLLMLSDTNYLVADTTLASELVPASILVGRPLHNTHLPFSGTVDRFLPSGRKFAKRVQSAFEDGFDIVAEFRRSPQEALFDSVYFKRAPVLTEPRYTASFQLTPLADELATLGESNQEYWRQTRAGTHFFGQSVKRTFKTIDSGRQLFLEERVVSNLADGSEACRTISGQVVSTINSAINRFDTAADRYLSQEFSAGAVGGDASDDELEETQSNEPVAQAV